MILLTPGPCATSESVRQAAALPDLNHRDPEYQEIQNDVRRGLLSVYPGSMDWTPCLIGGSGTAAVEAMVTSCIDSGPVLVIENGYYSERIRDILAVHCIPFESFRLGWLESWNERVLESFGQTLEKGFEAVLATHNETTVGRLNPIGEIARLAATSGARVLVDAMSSFGADPLDFEGIHAVASSANKCLHGIPGVSFVQVCPDLAAEMTAFPRRSYYLNLPMYTGESPPLTPPVPAMRAFRQALAENPGGQRARSSNYQGKLETLREGLSRLGLHAAVPPEESSCTLVTASLPGGWTFEDWYEANRREGYVLFGCKGDLRERFFQASVMGETSQEDMSSWLAVVERLLSLKADG
jgi:2-aminoethylphosphonate-pyruvate transaminase